VDAPVVLVALVDQVLLDLDLVEVAQAHEVHQAAAQAPVVRLMVVRLMVVRLMVVRMAVVPPREDRTAVVPVVAVVLAVEAGDPMVDLIDRAAQEALEVQRLAVRLLVVAVRYVTAAQVQVRRAETQMRRRHALSPKQSAALWTSSSVSGLRLRHVMPAPLRHAGFRHPRRPQQRVQGAVNG
jgi:hypothetical protein